MGEGPGRVHGKWPHAEDGQPRSSVESTDPHWHAAYLWECGCDQQGQLQMPARLQRIGSIACSSKRRDSPTVDISQEKKPTAALITQKWRLRSTQCLCVPVRSSFLHISTKRNNLWRGMVKWALVHLYCGVLLSGGKEWTVVNTLEKPAENCSEWKGQSQTLLQFI